MAELLVQDSSLTAIANAIREKAEIAGSLLFPQGFIEALANLKGAPDGISAITSGEYIPSADVNKAFTVTHDMGVAPNVMIMVAKTALTTTTSLAAYIAVVKPIGDSGGHSISIAGRNSGSASTSGSMYYIAQVSSKFTATTAELNSGKSTLLAGHEYLWVAMKVDGVA
jgi:hypothetical protein